MGAWIILALAIAAAVWAIAVYNGLVVLRNRFKNAFAQIDVQLRRRYDLIPNLVESVKGYLQHERQTLDAVVQARGSAVSAAQRALAAPGDPAAMQGLAQAEGALGGALGRLVALFENYPDLKANESVATLQEELTSTENKIGFARQLYNDVSTQYNTRQMQFPTNLVAGLANATPAELWEIEDAGERAVPVVDLTSPRPPAA